MAKKPIKVVYNHNPDPVTKITEYEYTGDGLKKTKETTYDKPVENKTYALTGTKDDKCILNGNTWKESEVGESISDIQKRVSDRVGKVYDPKTDQYVSIKTKEVK